MTAHILASDYLEAYSKAEIAFLWALAKELPDETILRAVHKANPPAPLWIVVDLRITSELKVEELGRANTLIYQRQAVYREALKALEELKLLAEEARRPSCQKCGDKMVEYLGPHRRRPRWQCLRCERGLEPKPVEPIVPGLTQDVINKTLQGRGSHFGG